MFFLRIFFFLHIVECCYYTVRYFVFYTLNSLDVDVVVVVAIIIFLMLLSCCCCWCFVLGEELPLLLSLFAVIVHFVFRLLICVLLFLDSFWHLMLLEIGVVFPCNPHRVFLCFASLLFSEQLIDWLNMFARVECLHGRFKILRKKRDKTAFECPRIWSCSFMSAFRCFCCCCCWSINCEGGRQIKSFESDVFESQNVSDVCCCRCRCCFLFSVSHLSWWCCCSCSSLKPNTGPGQCHVLHALKERT